MMGKLSDSLNVNDITQGCSKYQIPGCKKWKLKSATADLNLLTGDTEKDGWTLECGECDTGRADNFFNLEYEAGSPTITGKGCPL